MRRAECSARAGLFVLVVLAGLVPASAQVGDDEREPVDVALVLAVDVSRSMSLGELAIQRRGYAEAITSPEVLRAIARGAHGRIAITIFEWAAEGSTRELVPWTLIEGAGDAAFVAARLSEQDSRGARRTSISGAILTGMALLETMPFQADRRVIDVSGDGPNNHGSPVTGARDAAVARGIAINGLPMMTSDGFGTDLFDSRPRRVLSPLRDRRTCKLCSAGRWLGPVRGSRSAQAGSGDRRARAEAAAKPMDSTVQRRTGCRCPGPVLVVRTL